MNRFSLSRHHQIRVGVETQLVWRTVSADRALWILAGLAVALALPDPSHAQLTTQRNWNKPNGGGYAISTNWTPTGVPDSDSEDAVFGLASAYDVSINNDYTLRNVAVNDGNVAYVFPQGTVAIRPVYTANSLSINPAAGNAATLSLSGGDTRLSRPLAVGPSGDGTLSLGSALLTTGGGSLGTNAGAEGSVIVDFRSSWMSAGGVVIGGAGLGTLDVLAGRTSSIFGGTFPAQGDVVSAGAILGQSAGGRGEASVAGVWNTGDLVVGERGTAEITLRATTYEFPGFGSSIGSLTSGTAHIAAQPGSAGTVNITASAPIVGLARVWSVAGGLSVGGTNTSSGGSGRLAIGPSNEVAVGSDLKIWPGGALSLRESGALTVTGAANLGGALEFLLGNNPNPQLGHEFQILTAAGGVTGTFAATMLPPLGSGLAWSVRYNPTNVALRVVTAPTFTADFDEDGDVDGNDLLQWRGDFSGPGSDADDDGDSDGDDFLAWQQQLGSAGVVPAADAVPEPGGALLAVTALGALSMFRRLPTPPCRSGL